MNDHEREKEFKCPSDPLHVYVLYPASLYPRECARECSTEGAAHRLETEGADIDQLVHMPYCID
jgi:hypothetical protein